MDHSIYIYMYMNNRYTVHRLFVLVLTNYNMRGMDTYKVNRLGFDSDVVQLDTTCYMGAYVKKVDNIFRRVVTRWK